MRLDVPVASLRIVGQHDRAAGFAIDVARRQEWQRHHVERDTVVLAQVLGALQVVDRPMPGGARVGRIAADVVHPMPLEKVEQLRGRRSALAADVHRQASTARDRLAATGGLARRLSGCRLSRQRGRRGGCRGEKVTTSHHQLSDEAWKGPISGSLGNPKCQGNQPAARQKNRRGANTIETPSWGLQI